MSQHTLQPNSPPNAPESFVQERPENKPSRRFDQLLYGLQVWWKENRGHIATVSITVLLHAIALLILAGVTMPAELREEVFSIIVQTASEEDEQPIAPKVEVVVVQPDKLVDREVNDVQPSVPVVRKEPEPSPVASDVSNAKITPATDDVKVDSVVRTLVGDLGGRSRK